MSPSSARRLGNTATATMTASEVRRTADVPHSEPAGQSACAQAVRVVICHIVIALIVVVVIIIILRLTLFVVNSLVVKNWEQK